MTGWGQKGALFFSIWLIVWFVSPVFAQEDFSDLTLEELLNVPVVTATRQAQKSSDVPATVYVFSGEQIRARGYRNLEDLLEDVPEVEIQRKSNHETWNHISIRGIAGNEKFIVLMDGIRVSSPTGDHHLVGTNYPLTNARRVEVILGPASALYGVDAFSGIIHIITRSGEEVSGGRFTGSYGRFDTTDDAFVIGSKISKLSYAVTGQLYHSDEPFFPDYYPEEYDWYTNQYSNNGLVRLSPFAPPDVVLQVPIRPYESPTDSNFIHARVAAGDFEAGYMRNSETHSTSVSVRPEFTIYSADAAWESIIDSLYLRHSLALNDKWKMQTYLQRAAHTLGTGSKFINTFSGYNDAFKYAFGKSVKFEEQVTYSRNERSSLILGFSYEDLTALPKTSDLPFEFNPDLAPDAQGLFYLGTNVSDLRGRDLTIYQDFFNVEYANAGSFAQYQAKASDSIEFTIGSRYDYNTRYGSSFNPRLGLVLSPARKLKAKLLYGESFLAPSPYKAYEHFGSFFPQTDSEGNITGLASLFWRLPNPDLKAEKLRSAEAAVTFYAHRDFAFSANVYYTKMHDLIVEQDTLNQPFKGINVADVQTLINQGTGNSKGATFRVDSLWRAHGAVCNLNASYSYSDGETAGEILSYSARHTFKAALDIDVGKLSISPRLVWRSRTFHPRKDETGKNISNEPFALLNLYVLYSDPIRSTTFHNSVFLRISNLADQRYTNVRLQGAPASEFLATPQDPIRLDLGFTIDF